MINTDDRLLEQRPESLDTIGVYVAIYGCLGVACGQTFSFYPWFRLLKKCTGIDGQIEFSQILKGLPFLHNLTIVCRL